MAKSENITVIVNGKFHAFDYASELYKKGKLNRLISTMPYSKVKPFGIPRKYYKGFPLLEVVKILFRKMARRELPVVLYAKFFTKFASYFVSSKTDVIISFAGYSKEIFNDRRFGKAIKILDRGSTHTLENIKLKQQAADYHKNSFKQHSNEFVNRELMEYKLADFILVPSKFVKNTFIKNGVPTKKLILNSYAISDNKFSKEMVKVKREEDVILFVGQLSARKGIKVLIDAYRVLKTKRPNLQLWLVGAINDIKSEILDLDGVTYFGVLRGEELQDKFQRATLFCLPSFEEGLALVLTEAKFFNLPIVATPNTGVEDLFNESSDDFYLFEAGDPLDLAKKISLCLQYQNKNTDIATVKSKSWSEFSDVLLNKIGLSERYTGRTKN